MKTLLRWLIVPALVVGFGYFLRAEEPGEKGKTGKVLILKTGLVMEGDIEQVGSQMCVRRGTSEVWIAVDKTMRLSADWIDAYSFMQTLIKGDRAEDHVKLARWCHLHRLSTEAMEQATLALQLQPMNTEAKQIVTMLERASKEQTPKAVAISIPVVPARLPEPAPVVDVTTETLVAFSAKVQPILMNLCSSCHTGEAGGKFQLERVGTGQKVGSLRNLAAVLNHIDLDRPAISPLLVKAITPHGREPMAPIKDRGAKTFQSMQDWIVDTVKKNPQLKDYRAARKAAPLRMTVEERPAGFSSFGSKAPTSPEDVISRPAPRMEVTETKSAPMPSAAQERDWCHADWFNEWARSGSK